ncbi:MAG: hypothetical protein ABFS38_09285 [Bacteroidota bacterium]
MKFPANYFRLAGVTFLLGIFSFMNLYSQQQQQGFTYQAVARNLSGSPLTDQALSVRIGIHAESLDGELIWGEEQDVQTTPLGLFTLMVGDPGAMNKTGSVASFDQIDWSATSYFLRVWLKTDGEFMDMGGSAIQTVPIAQYATSAKNAAGNFSVQPNEDALPGEALFEVKRKDGQPVFAVYEDMVWVYSDPTTAKGIKGGFAVGGYNRTSKGVTEEYMRVTADSIRVYVNDDPIKGIKGGFAVGGYNRATKGLSQEFLRITPDSVRVYIDSDPNSKGIKGGFAVGGYNRTAKGAAEDLYLNVSGKSAVDAVDETSQIMWYPRKEAFLAGNIHVGSVDSVGQNSTAMGYKSIAMGNFSQAFGFRSMSLGDYSTSFGNKSIAEGEDSYALGSGAVASGDRSFAIGVGSTSTGFSSTALGTYSDALKNYATALGYRSIASGLYSHAFGLAAEASGERSMALGMGSQATEYRSLSMGYASYATQPYAIAIGPNSYAMGDTAISIGSGAEASGPNSVAIGTGTVASNTLATAIGYNARAEGYKSISLGAYYYKTFDFFLPIIIIPPIIFPKGGGEIMDLKEPDITKGTFVMLPLFADRDNQAVGTYSMAIGNGNRAENGGVSLGVYNDAMDTYSTAVGFGNQAVAPYSFAGGFANKTEGHYATAFGRYTSAASLNSFTIGTYNVSSGNPDTWRATDPLFQIGNGTGPDITEQHDAFRVNKNGGTYIRASDAVGSLWAVSASENSSSTNFGIISQVVRNNPTALHYSGYFYDQGSGGTYSGLYADTRSGGSIDVAEYIYDSHGDTEAGDVLVADKEKDESVLKSQSPYQTSVLGVVSTKPHMVMGMEIVVDEETGISLPGVSATRLALTGRVPVKITEENGPIEPGDLLTTSSIPGHAMKWSLLDLNEAKDFEELKSMLAENERRRNAIIGKAVGSSSKGEGTVMVLISLQ